MVSIFNLSPALHAACGTIGDSNTGAGREGNPQRFDLTQISIASDSTASSMQLNVTGTAIAGNLVALIYADNGSGNPGALLLQSPATPAVYGVNTIPMAIDLPAGQYWIGAWKENSSMEFWHELSGTNSRQSPNYASPVFPPNFIQNGPGFPGRHFALNFCDAPAAFTATPTPTPPATGGLCGNYGNDVPFGSSGTPANGQIYATRIYIPATGSTSSLNFYLPAGSGQVDLGLYRGDQNIPTSLIASTGPQTPSIGWNSYALPTVGLVPGYYWLALNSSGPINFDGSGTGNLQLMIGTFGVMPAVFNAQGGGSFTFSVYVTECGVAGTATVTRTFSMTSTVTKTVTLTTTETPNFSPTPTQTPSKTITLTHTYTPTLTPTPLPACFTLGTSAIGTTNVFTSGMIFSQKLVLAYPGRLTNINFYLGSVNSLFDWVAIYTDDSVNGRPGTLIQQSASKPIGSGWRSFAITPTDLVAGTYWLSFQVQDNSGLTLPRYTTSGGTEYHVIYSYAAFPGTMPAGGGTSSSLYMIYADLCDPAQYTATITATPSSTPGPCNVMGYTGPGPSTTNVNSFIYANKCNLIQAGRMNSVNVFFNTGNGGFVRVAVYDHDSVNNRPKNLLSQSASISMLVGWYNFALPQVDLPLGTYWLAIQAGSALPNVAYNTVGVESYSISQGYSTFPALMPAGGSAGTFSFNMYADVCDPAQYTATLTASPTRSPTMSFTFSPTPSATPTASPSATISSTFSATRTRTTTSSSTASPSATPTRSPTPTATASRTASPTGSPTASPSATRTATATATPSASPTATRTSSVTATPTPSPSATQTGVGTDTSTATPSDSPSATSSATDSPTPTPTDSPTLTQSETFTDSPTETVSLTATDSSTSSPTPTDTATASPTATPTDSPTVTSTVTQSATPSATRTDSPTLTATPSATESSTVTLTSSFTLTASPSATPSVTSTVTPSPTPTATPTVTLSSTDTPIASATSTPTITPTPSATRSSTPTATASATPSSTPSASSSPTLTASPTGTGTHTQTATSSATPSATLSDTPTATASGTATATPSPMASLTGSPSPSYTPSLTSTPSITATFSASPTRTVSPTITRTPTVTRTFTRTVTVSPTPAFQAGSLPYAVMGPVPVPVNGTLCFYYPSATVSTTLSIYNGPDLVLTASFGNQASQCVSAQGLAAGTYYATSVVVYADGTRQTHTQKIVIGP